MESPWTGGEPLVTHPHALLAPGAAARGSRSSRGVMTLLVTLITSTLLSCAAENPGAGLSATAAGESNAERLALAWMTHRQKADGSFATESFLPREIGTALVAGLLASVSGESPELGRVLHHSVKYFESLQSQDGAFRYPKCPDVRINTSLTLLALFACRDRDLGSYRNDGGYVELMDPRLLSRYFQRVASDPMDWDDFLERHDLAVLYPEEGSPDPEDLFRAARRAVAKKDAVLACEIRAEILRGQGPDGSWADDGPAEGRRIIATAYRIRTLELLRPLTSDLLVKR